METKGQPHFPIVAMREMDKFELIDRVGIT